MTLLDDPAINSSMPSVEVAGTKCIQTEIHKLSLSSNDSPNDQGE